MMIELVIAACLGTADCRDFRLLYSAYDVSLMTCMIAGQPEVARWSSEHPGWEIRRWHCGMVDTRAAEL